MQEWKMEIHNSLSHEDERSLMSPEFTGALMFSSIGIFLLARINFLFSHIIVEGWSIMVAMLIYILSVRTYRYSRDNILFFLGHAYCAIGFIDLIHTLVYEGMGVLPLSGTDMAAQLWISARYIEGLSLLIVPFIAKKRISRLTLTCIFGVIIITVLASIFKWNIFPTCYTASEGLTLFKILNEYLISLILIAAFVVIRQKKDLTTIETVRKALLLSIVFTIVSELSFTLYSDSHGLLNIMGHIFKLVSFYLIYEGIIISGLDNPFERIFKQLKTASMRDPLTGLYNRIGLMELSEGMLARVSREGRPIGCLMIDMDNFKSINDRFGHSIGDHVIQQMGLLLLRICRKSDITARIGGDEFLIFTSIDRQGLQSLEKRISMEFHNWFSETSFAGILDISIGSVLKEQVSFPEVSIDRLIMEADLEMYRHKESKKKNPEKAGVMFIDKAVTTNGLDKRIPSFNC